MSRVRARMGARAASILLASFLLLLLGASPASAHSELERSDPPNGGVVAMGRSALTLWFTEVISAEASTFELHTSDGARVAVTASVSEADDRGFVRITTAPLAKATYLLDWNVLASDDGHATTGSLVFGVGTRPDSVAPSSGGLPQLPEALLRWIDLSAIILAIGAVTVSGRVLRSMGGEGNIPRRRATFIGALALGVAVVTGAVSPLLLIQRGDSSVGEWVETTWATVIGTEWGQLWLARELVLVIAAVALVRARRSTHSRWMPITLVALTAVVVLDAWAGHASAVPRSSAVAVLASASHLAAAGVWAGGVTILAVCLVPVMRRRPAARGRILGSVWRTFSPMAAIATVVLLATGLFEAGIHIPELSGVGSTVYGGTVASKLVLFALALALAGINTLLVNPRAAARVARLVGQPAGWTPLSVRHFLKVVVAEVLVLLIAVGAAGVLTSVPTARDIAAATKPAALQSATVDGLFVTFEEVAAGPNQSRLIVRARSIVKLQPTPVSGVSAILGGPTGSREVTFERIEPGRFEAETAQLADGPWTASVTLERDGVPAAVTKLEWIVAAEGTEGVRPLEIVTSVLAGLLLAMLGAVLVARRRQLAVGPAAGPQAQTAPEEAESRR